MDAFLTTQVTSRVKEQKRNYGGNLNEMLGTGGSTGEAHYSQILRLGRLQVNSNTENMNMNTTKGFHTLLV